MISGTKYDDNKISLFKGKGPATKLTMVNFFGGFFEHELFKVIMISQLGSIQGFNLTTPQP